MTRLTLLRDEYHRQIGLQIVRFSDNKAKSYPNFADSGSRSSISIATHLCEALGFPRVPGRLDGQRTGKLFEGLTCEFVSKAFEVLQHLRPGAWGYRSEQTTICNFTQYQHLEVLDTVVGTNATLAAALGRDYIITPDVVVVRYPVPDDEINKHEPVVDADASVARLTQFRAANQTDAPCRPFLHASISCKWTIRSDRSQNTRTEALNLIRNRKGPLPHIVAVTAEPLPMRIASLALGTGDLDCVYHIALPELRDACGAIDGGEDQLEMLDTMIEGNRLRDISDLPLDLAV
ncbi:MAG: hypothetical protein KJ000_15000 [Pirellulaceae bacterium]|nr:hypothetical protein [Pirellulaceae bacterium]